MNPILAIINKIQDRYLFSPKGREYFFRFLSIFYPTYKSNSSHHKIDDLKKTGYLFFDDINVETINRLGSIIQNAVLEDPWKKGISFTLDSIPEKTHTAIVVDSKTLAACASTLLINESVLEVVSAYFSNKKFVLDSFDIWWSLPTPDSMPEEAQNFHRDRDSTKFLKWFIYITDVSSLAGPHQYIPGSHNSNKYLQSRRYRDEDFDSSWRSNIKTFEGKKGTNFIEDTYGMHRGLMPISERRLLIQFRFSAHGSIWRNRGERIRVNKKMPKQIRQDYVFLYEDDKN